MERMWPLMETDMWDYLGRFNLDNKSVLWSRPILGTAPTPTPAPGSQHSGFITVTSNVCHHFPQFQACITFE